MILILFDWPIVRRCSGAWGEKGRCNRHGRSPVEKGTAADAPALIFLLREKSGHLYLLKTTSDAFLPSALITETPLTELMLSKTKRGSLPAGLFPQRLRVLIVPTLCVGMPPGTLRVPLSTQGSSPAQG